MGYRNALIAAIGGVLACLGAWAAAGPTTGPAETSTLRGVVRDDRGPMVGAVARMQGTRHSTLTGEDGSFVLGGLSSTQPATITAWSEGYLIGWTRAGGGDRTAAITLKRYTAADNPDYSWFSAQNLSGSISCRECMPGVYDEWRLDAHSRSATNPRFLSMYTGSDLQGNRSPATRYDVNKDYGRFPLRRDPGQPYYGPGYKLDFPETQGNCAACHVPAAAARPGQAYGADVTRVSGVAAEGVFCEFCHKIGDVTLDPATGLPHPNMPGVLSLRLHRPASGSEEEIFFGPLDDVTRRVSYLPLQRQSAFCAPCHFGKFWGVEIYNSYGEWLASPYADPVSGKSCQDCHMPPTGNTRFALADRGGISRPHAKIRSHRMTGADDIGLLQDTARLKLEAELKADRLCVKVHVTNENAGHHIPTDHPARHILLVLTVTGTDGKPLHQSSGPVLPEWAGTGDEPSDYAGRPGKVYAKILEELWTEIRPTAAYWRQIVLRQDTRIPARATDTTECVFAAPSVVAPVQIKAKLVFRRAFKELAQQKKWQVDDILMEEEVLRIPP